MGALTPLLAALLVAVPSAAAAEPMQRWDVPIAEASSRFAIPADWIRRVIRAESGGRTRIGGRPTVSHAGAMGLMQLMPGTWAAMRSAHGLGTDPHDPRDNILAGTAYLRAMYDRFGYPGLFAAYNAGPARYADHLSTGRPLPAETVAYAALLDAPLPAAPAQAGPPIPAAESGSTSLFIMLGVAVAPPAAPPPEASTALFALLPGALPPGAPRLAH
jgi:soluble lytic murein transglycosylase-like protein